jgi:hypothetical protein
MTTISIDQLDTVTGGTLPAARRFVTTPENPSAIGSVNIAKGGKFAYVKNNLTGSLVRMRLAPLGTHAR